MKKIEIIWRELLSGQTDRRFTQKELAAKFGFSTSTVFQALKTPRKMGSVRVTGRFFVLEDPEKLLYHWASVRNLSQDIIFKTRVDLPVLEIEGRVPPGDIFACFSAARHLLAHSPADYDQVYLYSFNLGELKKRFPQQKGQANLWVLKADRFLANYGRTTSLAQTFVDLWNLSDWYAKDFARALKEKIDELLP